MSGQPARTVLFDLDGTLVDGAGLPEAMRATCEKLAARSPGVSASALVDANTAAWQRLWPDVEDDYLLGRLSGDAANERAWRATLAGAGAPEALLPLAVEAWAAEQRAVLRPYPDTVPTLETLRADGMATGLVSNGASSVQRMKLAVCGLAALLDPVVISGEAGIRKPDPRVFDVALAAARVEPEDAWFVGDNLWHDIAPAEKAGLTTVWIDRRGISWRDDWPRPDHVLRTLADLPALLGFGRA